MSRLQKKKPVKKKKKRNVVSDTQTDSSSGLANSSIEKSVKVTATTQKKSVKKLTETKTGEPNFYQKSVEFLKEVKVELKKVTWPTRKQTTGTTIVVIIFVFVVAAFLGVFDLGLSKLVQVVLT
ncbi:MAG: preprotein translocase subunit SecE [Deltaproteobacteria bacterium]|jgi:preprotein translocase subunit SecE|nr:preprotein translocase subunit SecE [Deltaproteobacteria bacterium]